MKIEDIHADRIPEWVKESVPAEYQQFKGRFGLPEPYTSQPYPLGGKVQRIDLWQANSFVVYRPETAAFLYGDYSPVTVEYLPGLLPLHEQLVREYTKDTDDAVSVAEAIVTRALPERLPHPVVPPMGSGCPPDRGLDDEPLLATGCAFCNEQARVFIRCCQIRGIQARLVFLFYDDRKTGHTTAEFYTGNKWAMVDVSWYALFPGPDGQMMSAAECHGNDEQREAMAEVYYRRMQKILTLSDEEAVGRAVPADTPDRNAELKRKAAEIREFVAERTDRKALFHKLWQFGLMNYPLPA